MKNRVCPQCNRKFSTYQAKYCSKDCYSLSQKGLDFLKGKRFAGIPWNKGIKSKVSKQNLITLECKECKGYFKVKPYRKNSAHFCSHECASQYRDEKKTSLNKKIRKSHAYKAWRTLVFERDNYTCQECGVHGGSLHADHIKPFSLYPELRLDPFNGRALCIKCHKNTPTFGSRTKNIKCVASAQEA